MIAVGFARSGAADLDREGVIAGKHEIAADT